jgi:hypothetical protein
MRLLFADTVPWQKVNDRFGLDLELAGKFVDSDLVCIGHAALRFGLLRLAWLLLGLMLLAFPLFGGLT